jgi:hypothetical protein
MTSGLNLKIFRRHKLFFKSPAMKKTVFLLVTLFFFCSVKGQSWLWVATSNTAGSAEGFDITRDPSGNVISVGQFFNNAISFSTTTLPNSGNMGVYVVKHDASGNMLWARTQISAAIPTDAHAVSTDAAGNIYVTGFFANTTCFEIGTPTLTSYGSHDIYVTKYDPSGNVQWAIKGGGTNTDQGWSISAEANGNTYVTGWFSSTVFTLGTFTIGGTGANHHFLAKIDPNGNVLWLTKGTGTGWNVGHDVMADNSGNVYLTGAYNIGLSFGTTTLTSSGNLDLFLVKYNSSGVPQWVISSAGPGPERGVSVSHDGTGNLYMSGYYGNTFTATTQFTLGTQTATCFGGYDAFISKIDANGNVLWLRTMNGPGSETGWSVSAYSGGVWTCGSAGGPTFTIGTSAYNNMTGADFMYIANYDLNGNLLFQTVINSGGDDENSIVAENVCTAYISGDYATNPFVVGSFSFPRSQNGEPAMVAKLTMIPPVSVSGNKICAGETATLSATGGTSYVWSTGSTSSVTTVQPIVNTVYTVTGTTACGISSLAVTVTVNPVPSISVTPSSMTVCSGHSATLIASGAASYTWSGGISNGLAFVPLQSTTYFVTGSLNDCTSTLSAAIQVDPIPTVSIVGAAAICAGETTTLSGAGAGSFTWQPNNISASSIAVTPTISTLYSLIGSLNNCTASALHQITVKNVPSLSIAVGPKTVCTGEPAFITASGAASYTWTGFAPGGTVLVNPVSTQIYTVRASDPGNSCVASGTAQITVINCSGINEVENESGLKIIPNPSRGSFSFQRETSSEGRVYLFSASGQLVFEERIRKKNYQFDLDLSPGLYTLVYKGTNGNVWNRKVIIE